MVALSIKHTFIGVCAVTSSIKFVNQSYASHSHVILQNGCPYCRYADRLHDQQLGQSPSPVNQAHSITSTNSTLRNNK